MTYWTQRQVLTKIDQVKGDSGPAQQPQLEAIQEEFADWAAEFQKNRTTKELQLAQSKLDAQAKAIERTRPVRELFSHAVDVVRGSLDAYTSHTGTKITYDLPVIPDDIFEKRQVEWEGSVRFTEQVGWALSIGDLSGDTVYLSIRTQELPHDPDKDSYDSDELSIYSELESSGDKVIWRTSPTRPNYATAPGLSVREIPLADHQTMTKVIRNLVETQLLVTYPR